MGRRLKNTYFLFCFLFALSINAQNIGLNWVKAFGTNSNEEFGRSISYDAAGNIYITGNFAGTVDFDPGPGTFYMTDFGGVGFYDVFIQKLDASGNFVWAKRFGAGNHDMGFSITNDASGNVYVAGRFEGTVDFDPGPASYTVYSSASGMDMFVCKFDPNGNFIWVKTAGSVNDDVAYSVFVDLSGNIYTTGSFEGGVDFDPGPGFSYLAASGTFENVFIQKLDASGNFIWAKAFGVSSSGGAGSSITADASGNVYTCGSFGGIVDFDPGPGTYTMAAAGGDAFASKLDVSGNFVWAKQIAGPSSESGTSINTLPGGSVLLSGNYSGGADLDPGPTTHTTNINYGGSFFVCLDGIGNLVWLKSIDNTITDRTTLLSTTTDVVGNIYSTGYFQGTVDFDMGAGTYSFSAMTQDIFIQKIDQAGSFIAAAAMTVGNSSSGRTGGFSIVADNSANVYVTGYFDATTDFDSGPYTNTISATNYKGDVFVLKLSPCSIPLFPGSITGNTVACPGSNLTYSTPSSTTALTYNWALSSGWTGTSTTNIINVVSGVNNGSISVTAVNSCGYSAPQTLSLTAYPSPTLTITGTNSICAGSTITLFGNGANTYTWSTSAISQSIAVSPSLNITYTVNGTDLNSCMGSAVKSVTVKTSPTPFAGTTASLICAGQTTTLYAVGADTYSWTGFGTGLTLTINPSITTTYTLTGTLLNGCSGTTTVVQNVSPCTGISAFSYSNQTLFVYPNPFNDHITIKCFGEITSIEIIDVLGRIVSDNSEIKQLEFNFETTSIPKGIYYLKAISNDKSFIYKIMKD